MPVTLTLRRQRQEGSHFGGQSGLYSYILSQNKSLLGLMEQTYNSSNLKAEAGGYKFIASLGYKRKPFDKMKQSLKAGELFSVSPIQVHSGKTHTLQGRGQGAVCRPPWLCAPKLDCSYSREMGHSLNL